MTWAGGKFEWDDDKALKNLRNHGVPFSDVTRFERETAMYIRDDRRDYGEVRLIAIGFIDVRVYVLVYTIRNDTIRVISLREANKREISAYEQFLEN
ncbi:MAG: BrnT family toxin [Pseudomonadota bacterium]